MSNGVIAKKIEAWTLSNSNELPVGMVAFSFDVAGSVNITSRDGTTDTITVNAGQIYPADLKFLRTGGSATGAHVWSGQE